jgi:hypothetical protein
MHSDIVMRQLERMLKVPLVFGSGCHPAAGRIVVFPKGWNILPKSSGQARSHLLWRK